MNVTDFADLTQNDAPAPAEAENRHPERGPAEGKQGGYRSDDGL